MEEEERRKRVRERKGRQERNKSETEEKSKVSELNRKRERKGVDTEGEKAAPTQRHIREYTQTSLITHTHAHVSNRLQLSVRKASLEFARIDPQQHFCFSHLAPQEEESGRLRVFSFLAPSLHLSRPFSLRNLSAALAGSLGSATNALFFFPLSPRCVTPLCVLFRPSDIFSIVKVPYFFLLFSLLFFFFSIIAGLEA